MIDNNENTFMEEDDIESPYCRICQGCGESGCCSPLFCEFHEDGKYCKTYLKDLQFAYRMLRDLTKYIDVNFDEDSKISKAFDELYDINYDKTYGKV